MAQVLSSCPNSICSHLAMRAGVCCVDVFEKCLIQSSCFHLVRHPFVRDDPGHPLIRSYGRPRPRKHSRQPPSPGAPACAQQASSASRQFQSELPGPFYGSPQCASRWRPALPAQAAIPTPNHARKSTNFVPQVPDSAERKRAAISRQQFLMWALPRLEAVGAGRMT